MGDDISSGLLSTYFCFDFIYQPRFINGTHTVHNFAPNQNQFERDNFEQCSKKDDQASTCCKGEVSASSLMSSTIKTVAIYHSTVFFQSEYSRLRISCLKKNKKTFQSLHITTILSLFVCLLKLLQAIKHLVKKSCCTCLRLEVMFQNSVGAKGQIISKVNFEVFI